MTVRTPKVLVVDDEPIICEQLSQALELEGVAAHCAVDGDDALAKWEKHSYGVVVTDLRMPNRHGHSLAVALLQRPERPKIVIFTGVNEPRIAADLLSRGVDAVVYKPVNYFDLATKIKRLLPSEPSAEPAPLLEVAPSVAKRSPAPRPLTLRERVEAELRESLPVLPWLKMTMQSLDWRRFANPRIEIPHFLYEPSHSPGTNERHEPQYGVVVSEMVVALGIDDDNEPIGDPFKMIMHTLSHDEVSLVHDASIAFPNLAIVWRGRDRSRVVAVLRNLRARDFATVCEIVGEIAWDESPSSWAAKMGPSVGATP